MKKVEMIEKNHIHIIRPHGEMTFFYLEELDKYIKSTIEKKEYKFIYDMTDVHWIDSMALGIIAMSVKNSLFNNSRVCVVKPNENVVELLRLSSLMDIIRIYETVEEAFEFLK